MPKGKKGFQKNGKPWNKGLKCKNTHPQCGFKKGSNPHNKGSRGLFKHTEETKLKIKIHFKGKKRPEMSGEKHYNWQGGKSFEEYSVDWAETLRRSIRERDNWTCRKCGKKRSVDIHHIDTNKHNNKENNLVCLCRSCHLKTHRQINKKYEV